MPTKPTTTLIAYDGRGRKLHILATDGDGPKRGYHLSLCGDYRLGFTIGYDPDFAHEVCGRCQRSSK